MFNCSSLLLCCYYFRHFFSGQLYSVLSGNQFYTFIVTFFVFICFTLKITNLHKNFAVSKYVAYYTCSIQHFTKVCFLSLLQNVENEDLVKQLSSLQIAEKSQVFYNYIKYLVKLSIIVNKLKLSKLSNFLEFGVLYEYSLTIDNRTKFLFCIIDNLYSRQNRRIWLQRRFIIFTSLALIKIPTVTPGNNFKCRFSFYIQVCAFMK